MSSSERLAKDRRRPPKPPLTLGGLWRSERFRGLLYQVAAVGLIFGVVVYMADNAGRAMALRGIQTGFSFLWREAGFTLGESILPFASSDSFLRAFLAGLGNTLWVSLISLFFATALGVVLGIARLSTNWLIARLAQVYIEIFRNTPQLIQIVFWYTLSTLLPSAKQAWHGSDWWFLSNRGLVVAWPDDRVAFASMTAALLASLVVTFFWVRWADDRRHRTGRALPVFRVATVFVVGVVLVAWLVNGAPIAIDFPRLAGFNFRGGVILSPEFLSLSLGLTLYFAAYIAEIFRSGIQSVGRGQVEAGRAVGLDGVDLYVHIILPQALRVIVPPITAQYISLVKTSALGVAIGYPELFNVSNTIVTLSGRTIECVAIMGLVYLALALSIAAVMNVLNRAITLRGGTVR